jgi:hypothetical protein
MSPRRQTVDQQDDVDDEDGTVEEESRRETDLKLHRRRADEVALGGTSAAEDENAEDENADDREQR